MRAQVLEVRRIQRKVTVAIKVEKNARKAAAKARKAVTIAKKALKDLKNAIIDQMQQ